MDRKLYPFATLQATGVADAGGRQGLRRRRGLCAAGRSRAAAVRLAPATADLEEHERTEDRCSRAAGWRWPPLRCWRGCAAMHQRRAARCPPSATGRPSASPAAMPSSACRRSRRRPSGTQRSKPPPAGPAQAPASRRWPPAQQPDVLVQLGARVDRADGVSPGTTRCGGAAASAAAATAPGCGPHWGCRHGSYDAAATSAKWRC